jgi:hypothetical protein
MSSFSVLLAIAALFAVVLGIPFGPYGLLTRGRRRSLREIRAASSERGWRFQRRRFLRSNPTEFNIRGQKLGGFPWVLKSRGTGGYDRGWTVRIGLRFPSLRGAVDFALLPRDEKSHHEVLRGPEVSSAAYARVAAFSGTAASALRFFSDAIEFPSGLLPFDERYRILGLPTGSSQPPPLDSSLAERALHWTAKAVAPHSILAWRDSFGFHVQARLPAPPNWETISYFVSLAEDMALRLPPVSAMPLVPQGFVDRLIVRFLRS